MTIDQEVELLRNIPLFAKVDPAKLKLLAFASERAVFAPGETLFHQGDPGDAAYIIMEGEAEVLINGPSGPIAVATIGKNDFVGEIAILCDVPRTATIRSRTALTTLRITKDLFLRMLMDFPAIAIEVTRVLAQRLEHTTERLRDALARK
ncbi:MAG TPA: cyclic nucleotide-binding domain-containing protein [Alphaproteobacteria bacterium]|jgi:CRP/FNR family cyclic AMP-dependent transcriptional regulator|nr:cyclic nucleotide-binding domain-containing protein [Alphaproteobacteria bacterium]